jgi:hypothetical protein
MMRTLLVEAAQTAARFDEELRRDYGRLKARKHSALAKVMVARKLAVRMYWMLRENKSTRKCTPSVRSLACRAARVIPWSQVETDRLSEHPASLNRRGVRSSESWSL